VETLRGDLVGVVRETMQPVHATLWLRSDTASSKKVEVSGFFPRIPSKVLTCTCGWWAQRPPLRSKCNASLSICATVGEEPEVELALV
jgi:hypothetical protein